MMKIVLASFNFAHPVVHKYTEKQIWGNWVF